MKILIKWKTCVWVRRSYLFLRADDIVLEHQLSGFRLSNEIGKSCETKENKYNPHVAKWLKSVDNANLVQIQCEAVYFFLFCMLLFHWMLSKCFKLTTKGTLSRSQQGSG